MEGIGGTGERISPGQTVSHRLPNSADQYSYLEEGEHKEGATGQVSVGVQHHWRANKQVSQRGECLARIFQMK